MKFRFAIIVSALALLLQACTTVDSDTVYVTIKTDARGNISSTQLSSVTGDRKKDGMALHLALLAFYHKIPNPRPNQTYRQPVMFDYTKSNAAKAAAAAKAKQAGKAAK
ncbi:hypothetical protein [Agrobacterium sp.]|uniref:hypothetical protein n=1 Tax=Agrobacterium sp. TaxID=361 RepID=UPI0028A88437|nr:hypothetical protein [Agrobacterium sp.]